MKFIAIIVEIAEVLFLLITMSLLVAGMAYLLLCWTPFAKAAAIVVGGIFFAKNLCFVVLDPKMYGRQT